MQLEVGRSYLTKSGRVVTITRRMPGLLYEYIGKFRTSGPEVSYMPDGRFFETAPDPYDIVSEVATGGRVQNLPSTTPYFIPIPFSFDMPSCRKHTWHDNGGMMNTYCTVCDADGQWDRSVFAYVPKARTE